MESLPLPVRSVRPPPRPRPAPPGRRRRGVLFLHEMRVLLGIAGPIILAQLGGVGMNTMDTIMVGPLGAEALAAAGLASSRGSVAKLRSQLHLARDLEYIGEADFRRLLERCLEITRMLTSLRKSLG